MAVIDRYLEAMQKQGAEALVFKTGSVIELVVGGQARHEQRHTLGARRRQRHPHCNFSHSPSSPKSLGN